ncbi:hypothetical protein NQ317_000068 [Molorchus minor]|uniref:Uncharacterized protein n=1 Tax=Molorchus minor TaxID=1323400 RepID=A0ABQ9JHX7_9CUCU|nr:hypothetical protein NQ317_000068 [Molorchus minor]
MPSAKKTKRKRCAPLKPISVQLITTTKTKKKGGHLAFIADFYEICDKFLSSPLAEIIKLQVVLKDKKPKARRYDYFVQCIIKER